MDANHGDEMWHVLFKEFIRVSLIHLLSRSILDDVFEFLICSHKLCGYSWFISRMPCVWDNLSKVISYGN